MLSKTSGRRSLCHEFTNFEKVVDDKYYRIVKRSSRFSIGQAFSDSLPNAMAKILILQYDFVSLKFFGMCFAYTSSS